MKKLSKISILVFFLLVFSGFSIYKSIKSTPSDFRIVKRWDLPVILKEISGISIIGNTKFACIQDELGSIFIYDIESSTLQKEIPFAGPGDFEDVSLVNDTAWVLRSDGKLFEVASYSSKNTSVKEYNTSLTARQNTEGMCYDKENNRLLLAVKDGESVSKNYKGIYSFDLVSKTMSAVPVFKIDLHYDLKTGNKKRNILIMPSGIAIHPQTKEIYVTDAHNSLLLILNPSGSFKSINDLDEKEFHQAEGIAFDSNGGLFISNEASKGGGNILKVEAIKE